jgi:hypothetical protein
MTPRAMQLYDELSHENSRVLSLNNIIDGYYISPKFLDKVCTLPIMCVACWLCCFCWCSGAPLFCVPALLLVTHRLLVSSSTFLHLCCSSAAQV